MTCNIHIAVIAALATVIAAAPQYSPQYSSPQYTQYTTPIPIVSQKQEVNPDGSYFYSYQTANGIAAEEKGTHRALGPEEGIQSVQGYFTYTGPDGVQYQVTYTADENGFVPQGAHLPTPPPIPAELAKALEALPPDNNQYDERGFPINRPFGR